MSDNMNSPRTIDRLHAEMLAEDPGCCLTKTALRRLVRSGQIRSVTVGTKYLVTRQAVNDFLNGCKDTPATVAASGIRRIDM